MKLNSKQVKFIKAKLLKPAKEYAAKGNTLAVEDVKLIKMALEGRVTEDFISILTYNVEHINSHPIWKVTSQEDADMMLEIIKVFESTSLR